MRVLITGGAGFIGSNLAGFLAGRHPGWSVMVLDSSGPGLGCLREEFDGNPDVSFWLGDVRDEKLLGNLMGNSDIVVHLAARTAEEDSPESPGRMVGENIASAAALLEAARANPPAKLIHVSASEVYGNPRTLPVTEEHPLMPQTPYGGSKAAAEMLVLSLSASCGIASVILRPFNVYGPRQGISSTAALFITNGIRERPIPIHGDGSATGDWIFVEDFCRAVDKAILAEADELSGEIINLGTGREKSLNEVAGCVLDLLGAGESLITFVDEKPGLPRQMVASVSKAELLLGWKPETEFRQGMKTTVNWYLENQQWWRKA